MSTYEVKNKWNRNEDDGKETQQTGSPINAQIVVLRGANVSSSPARIRTYCDLTIALAKRGNPAPNEDRMKSSATVSQ